MPRETSTYNSNVTASLKLIHKNAGANETSFLYEAASYGASVVHEHVLTPALGYVKGALFNATPPASPQPSAKAEVTPLSAAELKQRRIDAEAESVKLRDQVEVIQDQIKPLLVEKKRIDTQEKQLKQSKRALSARDSQRRLALLAQIDDLLVQKLELMGPLITEHAAKRVDLMLLLMIAVYRRNLIISKGDTNRQHGKGSNNHGTAACHVSMIPHPVFHKPQGGLPSAAAVGHYVSDYVSNYVSGFFSTAQARTKQNKRDALAHLEEVDFLKGSYLQDILNMTTELPNIVNQFDGHMEGKWDKSHAVKASLEILNLVSKGELDPIQGISQYGKVMANFFSHIEYTYISHKIEYKPHAAVLYPKAFAKVWHYQQPGTLSMFNITTKAIDDNAERKHVEAKIRFDYVYLMLGLHQLPSLERAASYALSAPIEKRVLEMQHEMLSTQSSFDKREVEAPEKLEPSVLSQFLSLG